MARSLYVEKNKKKAKEGRTDYLIDLTMPFNFHSFEVHFIVVILLI
jgi:hypothetical protein